jgi:hypothetical protein
MGPCLRRFAGVSTIALGAVSFGCNGLVSAPSQHEPPDPPAVHRAPVANTESGASLPTGLSGTYQREYRSSRGRTLKPVDLTQTQLIAYVPNSASPAGYDEYRATTRSDGTFDVPGVPAQPYFFALIHTNAAGQALASIVEAPASLRHLAIVVGAVGRSDTETIAVASPPATPTLLELTIANLAPWSVATDQVFLFSEDAGLFQNVFLKPAPAEGATTLAGQLKFHGHRVDAAKGDRAAVLQFATQNEGLPGSSYVAMDRAMGSATLSVAPGQTTQLAGSFIPLPKTHSQVTWRHGAFAALIPQMAPHAVNDGQFLSVYASPDTYFSNYSLLEYDVPDAISDEIAPIDFGNPYPPSWSQSISAGVSIVSQNNAPDGTPLPSTSASASCTWDMASVTASASASTTISLEPSIGPVQWPTIEGHDAFAPSEGVGTTPTLRWLPPRFGTPNFYGVDIRDLSQVVYNGVIYEDPIGITTKGTSLRIFPGLLQPGHKYRITISAIDGSPTQSPSDPLLPFADPSCDADVALGIVSP